MDFAMDLLLMAPAVAVGWLVIRILTPIRSRLLQICLGVGVGAGVTSCSFFLLVCAGVSNRATVLASEAALLAIALAVYWRWKRPVEESVRVAQPSWIWILRATAVVALCFFGLDFSESAAANPAGQYDAAAIWNLRARYLAAGTPAWHYAVSEKTHTDHPGYPLLTSGFIAQAWVMAGDAQSPVPVAVSLIFSVAVFGVVFGGVAAVAGECAGWLALLVLLASEGFVSQAAAQYADVPLSFYILASMALLATAETQEYPAGRVALAGLLAGFAAWTKNEGIVFAVLLGAVALWRGGTRTLMWIAAGAAPGLLITLSLKLMVVGREAMFPATAGDAAHMMTDPARWMEIVKSFAHNFWELGFPWAHPFLLMAIAAWAFGLMRGKWWLLAPTLGLLAADFGIYLISATGLTWHLSTSNNRVIAQVWPAILFGFFAMLRAPVVEAATEETKKSAGKRRGVSK